MDSEDLLFILYTSGSTGKPKGMVHTCGGYMVYTTYTFKMFFNIKKVRFIGARQILDGSQVTPILFMAHFPQAQLQLCLKVFLPGLMREDSGRRLNGTK